MDKTRASGAVNLNETHIAIYSWDGATGLVRLDVDGVLSTLSTSALNARGSAAFAIGKCATSTNYFRGQIADIRFYNTALSVEARARLRYELAQTYGVVSSAICQPGSLSAGTVLSVASDTTVILNGVGQTVAGLQGVGTVSNGTLTVTGTLAPGGTNAVGTLTVGGLVMAESATYDWNYSDSASDVVCVPGTLSLPSSATIDVSRVTGATANLPDRAVLFSCGDIENPEAVKDWVVTGGRGGTRVSVQGQNVLLLSVSGTLISVR